METERWCSFSQISSPVWNYADSFCFGQAQSWNAKVTPEYGGRRGKTHKCLFQDDYKLRAEIDLEHRLTHQIRSRVGMKSRTIWPL